MERSVRRSLAGLVQFVAADIDESIEARAVLFERDLRTQLDELVLGEAAAQALVERSETSAEVLDNSSASSMSSLSTSLKNERSSPGIA
jgi:hypothetical protein